MDDPRLVAKLVVYTVMGLGGFGVVLWIGAVLDRVDAVARRFGWWGRLRCNGCRKHWRCVKMCEQILRDGRQVVEEGRAYEG